MIKALFSCKYYLLILGVLLFGFSDNASGQSGRFNSSPREPLFSSYQVFSAFTAAYPGRVSAPEFKDGEWRIRVGDREFRWAEGRMLPEGQNTEDWAAHPFYQYETELPPLPELSDEEEARLNTMLDQREENPPSRHTGVYNALWRIHDRQTSDARAKTTYFLGKKTMIHRELLEDLAKVEETILRAALSDRNVQQFIEGLGVVEGYNFRRIAGTATLSFHSYGVAVDLIPKSYGGKQAYWLWEKEYNPQWYKLPYERRYMPPEKVVKAFESNGFVWGGKWFFYDTMHFEYRPEILSLNGFTPEVAE